VPRPKKRRRVSGVPPHRQFGPHRKNKEAVAEAIFLSVDEYETLRLIDYQRKTQKEASEIMGVSRTTVQAIYDKARMNVTTSLVEGKNIVIDGGDYVYEAPKAYRVKTPGKTKHDYASESETVDIGKKPHGATRIVISTIEGEVSHIGEAEDFKVFDLENTAIINKQTTERPDIPGGFLPSFLKRHDVDIIIGAEMGEKLKHHFDDEGIDVFITDKAYPEDALSHWRRSG